MKICYFPQDFSASGMYRCVFPFRELEKAGHYCKTPFYSKVAEDKDGFQIFAYDMRTVPLADVYVFQQPLDASFLQTVRDARAVGAVTVGETDDSGVLPEWHPAFKGTSVESNPVRNREWRARVFSSCDAVTCPTEALAEEWRPRNRNVKVLPNYLLLEMWENVQPQFEVERERVRVGWMGKSFWRAGDLAVLKPVIRPFLERNPDVDFVAAGDGTVHDLLEVPEDRRVTVEGVPFPRGLAQLTAQMDIGLVPLSLGTPEEVQFNNSKSNLKGMEYAACGIPCIASPSEPYKKWIDPGSNGFLAGSDVEWAGFLDLLVRDHHLRRRMGADAQRKVRTMGISVHAHKWESFYQDLIDKRRRQTTWGDRASRTVDYRTDERPANTRKAVAVNQFGIRG